MKIIGGHDYYDGAGFGVDETIVFVRKEKETWDSPFDLAEANRHHPRLKSHFFFHYVLVAGKVYPAIREYSGIKILPSGRSFEDTTWHYSEKDALQALEKAKRSTGTSLPFGLSQNLPDQITRHFRENTRAEWTNWMIENRVVTGLVSYEYRNIDLKGTIVRTNISSLKDIQFYRVLDPATIHMEISNYLGGVLPSMPQTVDIEDRDRIRKAGFDVRRSFRQDPGVKKPRRRKSLKK
jgi:hypothetical protein